MKRLVESRPKGKGSRLRLAKILGILSKDNQIKADIDPKDKSKFTQIKWQFLLGCPFDISNKCCDVMKKRPSHKYTKDTGRYPITAQMASESLVRTQSWLKNGCNAFDAKNPISNPMSFWVEQDVLLYIKKYNTPIASVYGEVVDDNMNGDLNLEGVEDLGLFDVGRPFLQTTGENRTGCMWCGFGCHFEKEGDGRFLRLKKTHPQIYDYIMKPESEGGLGYKDKIDWINKYGGYNIQY